MSKRYLAALSTGACLGLVSGALSITGIAATAAAGPVRPPEAMIMWQQINSLRGVVDDQGASPEGGGGNDVTKVELGDQTYVAWLDSRSDDLYGQRNAEVELRSTRDDGRTWSPLSNVSRSPTYWEKQLVGASDGSSALLVAPATTPRGPSYATDVLRMTRLKGDGSDPETFDVVSNLINVGMSGAAGMYYLVGETGGRNLTLTRSADRGSTWTPGIALAAGCHDGAPSVAASGMTVAVAWRSSSCGGGNRDVKVVVSNDQGLTWGTPIELATTPQTEYPPTVTMDDDSIMVAWPTLRSATSTTVEVASSLDEGATWSLPSQVAELGATSQFSASALQIERGDAGFVIKPRWTPYVFTTDELDKPWTTAGSDPALNTNTVLLLGKTYLAFQNGTMATYTGRDPSAPNAPRSVAAVPQINGSVTVNWVEPEASDLGAYSYTVTANPGGQNLVVEGSRTWAIFEGLDSATSYTFTVRASNPIGTSPPSEPSNPVTPAGTPGTPTNVVTSPTRGAVDVSWEPSDANGSPVQSYLATTMPGGKTCVTSGATSCTVSGLAHGNAYTIEVMAYNAVGASPASEQRSFVIPRSTPLMFSAPSVVPGDGLVQVSWAPADDGGLSVSNYTVTAIPGGRSCGTSSGLTCTVNGLSNGLEYRFTVAATNALGTGPASAVSAAARPVAPVSTPIPPVVPVGPSAACAGAQGAAADAGTALSTAQARLAKARKALKVLKAKPNGASPARLKKAKQKVRSANQKVKVATVNLNAANVTVASTC